jgi:hypothetical protein
MMYTTYCYFEKKRMYQMFNESYTNTVTHNSKSGLDLAASLHNTDHT